MREKIARAMYDATPFKETEGGYDQQSDAYKRMCLLLADATLDALMEPTAGMLHAALPHVVRMHQSRTIFTAMIRAAKEGS